MDRPLSDATGAVKPRADLGENIAVGPHGLEGPDFVAGEDLARMWTSALAHCQHRFGGKGRLLDEPRDLPYLFRFSRYETGYLHPTNHSLFPQS